MTALPSIPAFEDTALTETLQRLRQAISKLGASLATVQSNLDTTYAQGYEATQVLTNPQTGLVVSMAQLQEELQLLVTDTSAAATRISTLEAQVNDPTTGLLASSAAVQQQLQALASDTAALASRTTNIEARINHRTTGLLALSASITEVNSAIATLETATASSITNLQAQLNDPDTGLASAHARITTAETALVTQTVALAERVSQVAVSSDGLTALISAEEQARIDGDDALAQQIEQLIVTGVQGAQSFAQTTAPANPELGWLWFDTDDNNKLYRYSGSAWVLVDDLRIAANTSAISTEEQARILADGSLTTQVNSAISIANAKSKITAGVTAPGSPSVGDVWVDATSNNVWKVWDGSQWVDRTDVRLPTTVASVNTLTQTVADNQAAISLRADVLEAAYGNSREIADAFSQYPTVADFQKIWSIQGAPPGHFSFVADGNSPGGKNLRITGTAGWVNYDLYHGSLMPVLEADTYECRATVYVQSGSVEVYVGVIPYDALGNPISPGDYGTYNYFGGYASPLVGPGGLSVVGYNRGRAAVGAGNPVGFPSPPITAPGKFPLNTVAIRPIILVYNMQPGDVVDILDYSLRNVSETYDAHARITTVETAFSSADSALASRATALEATVFTSGTDSNAALKARIEAEEIARAGETGPLASRATALEATVFNSPTNSNAALKARVDSEESARITQDGIIASNVTNLTTTVGNLSATVTQQGTSINGISAKYSVTLDVNGAITGYQLIGGGGTSEFRIRADKFIIEESGNPAGGGYPFEYSGGVLRVKEAVIPVLNADKINIDNVTLDTDGAGQLIIRNNGVGSEQLVVNATGQDWNYFQSGFGGVPNGFFGDLSLNSQTVQFTVSNPESHQGTVTFIWTLLVTQGNNNSDAVDFRMVDGLGNVLPQTYDDVDVSGASTRPNSITLIFTTTVPAATTRAYTLQGRSNDSNTGLRLAAGVAMLRKKAN